MEATYLKAIEAGVDIIDTALSPLSGGTSQVATEAFHYILKDTPYDPKLDIHKLNQAATKLTIIKDEYLKNGILNPKALTSNPSILEYQVPGGMLSNLMSQLKEQNQMEYYEKVLREVPKVRKDLGYPPLVTPISQMVGTQAVMNVMTDNPYKIVSKEVKEYLHGLYGKAPAKVNSMVLAKIIGNDEVITHRPADDLKPEFEDLKKKYEGFAKSDEDLLSIALFGKVAIEFLEKKYQEKPKPKKEVYAFSVTIGGDAS
jgi:oxaloacetate decarboxylase (Na+ extruding) subunit alpha